MSETKFNMQVNEYLPLRDVVFRTLRDAILTGKLVPGERLMENTLALELGVSRTPVREALRMLELERLVELAPRKGAQVLAMTEQDLHDILEIRSALEGLATSLAARKVTAAQLVDLRDAHEAFEQAVNARDVNAIIACDEVFHDLILKTAGNDKLAQIYQNLKLQLYRYRMAHLQIDTAIPAMIAHHRGLLQAIEHQNEAEALNLAQEHIKHHTDFVLQAIRKNHL